MEYHNVSFTKTCLAVPFKNQFIRLHRIIIWFSSEKSYDIQIIWEIKQKFCGKIINNFFKNLTAFHLLFIGLILVVANLKYFSIAGSSGSFSKWARNSVCTQKEFFVPRSLVCDAQSYNNNTLILSVDPTNETYQSNGIFFYVFYVIVSRTWPEFIIHFFSPF